MAPYILPRPRCDSAACQKHTKGLLKQVREPHKATEHWGRTAAAAAPQLTVLTQPPRTPGKEAAPSRRSLGGPIQVVNNEIMSASIFRWMKAGEESFLSFNSFPLFSARSVQLHKWFKSTFGSWHSVSLLHSYDMSEPRMSSVIRTI